MPKDPKRNIQNYQLRGGHLNEYEFQKSQGEMTQESELPFTDENDTPNLAQATKRVAEVTAKAHVIVEKRKKRELIKGSAKRVTTKSTKKAATRAGTKKRVSATSKRSARKVATKSAKKTKTTSRAATKKRASVKSSRQKSASDR